LPTARLEIAYDGARFAGWASQPGQRSVEAEIEGAIERILGERPQLEVAGRTDAGVHATRQVASFEHTAELPDRLAERLSAVLPADVAIRDAGPAPDGFDARRDARSRTYRYRVLASQIRDPLEDGRALWWRHPIARELLDRAAAAVVGRHDFTAFTPTRTEHVLFVRDVERCEWTSETDSLLRMEIEAEAFMRNMVRALVGTMLEVAGGRRSLGDFASLLDGAPRAQAGETAPPHGLYLVGVRY
jgi:tRNA pseudouridine38-40 synthase